MVELAAGHLRPSVAILLSQSGASVTSIEAARLAQKCGADVFRITAEGASPFAQLAPDTLVMPIGPEPIGPKTKGYAASLTALAALADWIAGRSGKEPAVRSDLSSIAASRCQPAEPSGPRLRLVVGQRAHLGTALEARSISRKERIPAAGVETEEALHGGLPGYAAQPCDLIASNARRARRRRVAASCATSAHCGILGPASRPMSSVPPTRRSIRGAELDSITAIVPFQWLAWALARHRGLDPARMRYPGLSQRLAIKTGPPT